MIPITEYINALAIVKAYEEQNALIVGDITIDIAKKSVTKNKVEILLTQTEYDLLVLLAQNKNTYISKKEIQKQVWGTEFETNTNSIEVFISFLRMKIGKKTIERKTMFGYRMVG